MASLLNTPVKRDVEELQLLGGYSVVDPCEVGYHIIKPIGTDLYSCTKCKKKFSDDR